jgi:hypothetical protein
MADEPGGRYNRMNVDPENTMDKRREAIETAIKTAIVNLKSVISDVEKNKLGKGKNTSLGAIEFNALLGIVIHELKELLETNIYDNVFIQKLQEIINDINEEKIEGFETENEKCKQFIKQIVPSYAFKNIEGGRRKTRTRTRTRRIKTRKINKQTRRSRSRSGSRSRRN